MATAPDQVVRLRPMRGVDLAAVMALERKSYPFPWSEGIFRDCLRIGYCSWVAEAARTVVGYAVMSVAAGEGHLLNLCIDPDHHGEGLGKRLLRHMLRLAREHGADTAFLEVRPSNAVALALYRDAGFVEVGMRRAYYPAGRGKREDAIVLAMQL